jgi:hypothetical protein
MEHVWLDKATWLMVSGSNEDHLMVDSIMSQPVGILMRAAMPRPL